tara:strand:+ start:469 stop:618 length:150 start_codon:yes stop_codon:yes gene_type:complete
MKGRDLYMEGFFKKDDKWWKIFLGVGKFCRINVSQRKGGHTIPPPKGTH